MYVPFQISSSQFRHGEERGDEAIHQASAKVWIDRYARNRLSH
jgi:hypothetical protein